MEQDQLLKNVEAAGRLCALLKTDRVPDQYARHEIFEAILDASQVDRATLDARPGRLARLYDRLLAMIEEVRDSCGSTPDNDPGPVPRELWSPSEVR